jgi:hypothetical protein
MTATEFDYDIELKSGIFLYKNSNLGGEGMAQVVKCLLSKLRH